MTTLSTIMANSVDATTHQQLTDAQLEAGGVGADLIRLSVGLEDTDDIMWDLDQALAATA